MNEAGQWNTEPELSRNGTYRISTMKKLRRLFRRYLGLKERPKTTVIYSSRRSLLEEPSTSYSSSKESVLNRSRSRSMSFHLDKRARSDHSSLRNTRAPTRSRSLSRSQSHKSLAGSSSVDSRLGLDNISNGKEHIISPSILDRRSLQQPSNHHAYQEDSDSGMDSAPDSRSYPDLPAPCLKGINNLGNTCYMNSVLQCLSVVDSLAEYFVLGHFVGDLKNQRYDGMLRNTNGTNGVVTSAFANVLKSLWHNDCSNAVIQSFRNTLGRYNTAYRSFVQQDAQELLVWLLDKIHEDLNHSEEPGCSQQDREFEMPISASNNRSIISDLFEAEFRSSIRCRSCTFTKLNYDPFMCVSLQIPYDSRRPFYVTLVYFKRERRRLLRYGLYVECTGRICDIKECVSAEAKIPESKLLIFSLNANGFLPMFSNKSYVSELTSNELSVAEMPIERIFHHDDVFIIFVIIQVSNDTYRYNRVRLTEPFVCLVPQRATYHSICLSLYSSVRADAIENDGLDEEMSGIFRSGIQQIRAVGKDGNLLTVYPTAPMPLCTDDIQSLLWSSQKAFRSHIPVLPLVVEFKEAFIQRHLKSFLDASEHVFKHESCEVVDEMLHAGPASLEQCLNEFSSVEYIDWTCENCGMNGAEKTMMFHTLPQILVIHLKRFRQSENRTMIKLDRAIHYPVERLNLAPYVFHSNRPASILPQNYDEKGEEMNCKGIGGALRNSSQDPLFVNTVTTNSEYIYDLIAVVHHVGVMVNSGHYTATTRNAVDGKWRNYDDNIVRQVDPAEAADGCTAYLLFYEKRTGRRHLQAQPTSGHSSSESGIHEHWFSRTPSEIRKHGGGVRPLSANLNKAPVEQNDNFSRYILPASVHSSIRRTYIQPVEKQDNDGPVQSRKYHSMMARKRRVTKTEVW